MVNEQLTSLTKEEARTISLRASSVFRPSAPIDAKDLFYGRINQVTRVIDAIFQLGRHVIIFGERGVGKTSLARVLNDFLKDAETSRPILTPLINCMETDNFSTIWQKIFSGIDLIKETQKPGFYIGDPIQINNNLGQELSEVKITAEIAERNLKMLSSLGFMVIVIIDELDKLKDEQSRRLLTQTLKSISDHLVDVTIVLVGVSDTIVDLVADHQSIIRNLTQIKMPRMSKDELCEIIVKGISQLGMIIEETAVNRIVSLSIGLPHYTHLLGLHAVRSATDNLRKKIINEDITEALKKSIQDSEYSVRDEYEKAVASSRETIYKEVLLACALAEANDLGYFSAVDVRKPLTVIMKKKYEIPNYARHLNEFAGSSRRLILQREECLGVINIVSLILLCNHI